MVAALILTENARLVAMRTVLEANHPTETLVADLSFVPFEQ